MNRIIKHTVSPKLSELLRNLHFEENSEQAEIAEELFEEAEKLAAPCSTVNISDVAMNAESVTVCGVDVTYPHVMKMLDCVKTAAAYVTTCGTELEEWSNKFADPLDSYIADAVKVLYLYKAQAKLQTLADSELLPGSGHLASLNPGSLNQWPLPEQKKLFAMLGGEDTVKNDIGVTLTRSFLMLPSKSISGIFFRAEKEYENCELCPRITCPNRRAPYRGEMM